MIRIVGTFFFIVLSAFCQAAITDNYQIKNNGSLTTIEKTPGCFTLAENGFAAPLVLGVDEDPGVIRIARYLQNDIQNVTQILPGLVIGKKPRSKEIVVIATLGKSKLIDRLVSSGKVNVDCIRGKWESTLIQVVDNPLPGVRKALVIVGSDKRGTIYGMFELSRQIGVSPWYFWADMPVEKNTSLFVNKGRFILESPKVKYRGIFINDEAPALSGWVFQKFGGFNHQFYEHVFELILRLKGNFLWPAMWGRAFYDDDPLNPKLADEFGIVIGTSHHEPMMRAHDEWRRFGSGKWNYEANPDTLKKFWADGITRKNNFESLVTVGMRGDGDEPMSESSNIALLEKIVNDQRGIIEQVTGKPAQETPQVWALYKEVQDYYDKGMRVPDDITLLLCDDNWGNVRKLPKTEDLHRQGGFGMYYHFDYVGGPRNYKWLNTNPLPRIWEQMNMTYQYGVDRIWIVNVGDIKPMEFPIEFFLDMAWNPDAMTIEKLDNYSLQWSEKYFGKKFAPEIARMLNEYGKFNSRRKPELLNHTTYNLHNYRESETIVNEYNKLAVDAENLYRILPDNYKDAFYQLVLFPVKACANLNDLYYSVALNRLYAKQGRAATNEMADKVKRLFETDSLLSWYYNNVLAAGKWKHMMDQTHIGYTYWQEPPINTMPAVEKITAQGLAKMGISVEASSKSWPNDSEEFILPVFDNLNQQQYYFEVFNCGLLSFKYACKPREPWIKISSEKGVIEKQKRIYVSVDWENAPKGKSEGTLDITGSDGGIANIIVPVFNLPDQEIKKIEGFVETNGYLSIEAASFSAKTETSEIKWKEIPGLGKTVSGMTTFPVNEPGSMVKAESPRLDYNLHVFTPGGIDVSVFLSPTLDFQGNGLRYAVSVDNQEPQIVDFHNSYVLADWETWVSNNIIKSTTKHVISSPGKHVLHFWRVDPGVVLQKIVLDMGGLKPAYLGPPQSFHAGNTQN